MPRGNDNETQEQALHALADEFGDGVGNAEELIAANAARFDAEMVAISSLPVLEEKTAEIDLDKLKGPNGEYVVDAAWRGSGNTAGLVVIYEDSTGRLLKHLAESNTDGSAADGPRRSSHAAAAEKAEKAESKAKAGSKK